MNQQLKLADLEVQVQNSTDLTKKILLQWSQTVFGGADDRPGNNILYMIPSRASLHIFLSSFTLIAPRPLSDW